MDTANNNLLIIKKKVAMQQNVTKYRHLNNVPNNEN